VGIKAMQKYHREKAEFETNREDSEAIVMMRYKHHLNRVRELLNEVI
jgi:hypothetical protein